MTYNRPPIYIPANRDWVLAVIRDSYRQQCRYDCEAEPGADLTFESTIDDWRNACDLVSVDELGPALNAEWNLDEPAAVWREQLRPTKKRTLRELCEFIAARAVRPSIEPVRIMGTSCLSAGAFVTIRSLLREAGADVGAVAPSTRLEEYTRHYGHVFLGPISGLAPNTLPEVTIHTPEYDKASAIYAISYLLGLFGWTISRAATSWAATISGEILMAFGVTLCVISWISMAIITREVPPALVTFGELRTFRELARVIARASHAVS